MNAPFVIFTLPRSRSRWLSCYLSYRGWLCGHDQIRYVRSPEDVKSWLSLDYTGTVETAAAPFWRMVHQIRPDTRTVVVRRPIVEVADSLKRTGIQFDDDLLIKLLQTRDRKLDQVERHGALSIAYHDLNTAETRAKLFERCLGLPFDPDWDARLAPANIQGNLPAMVRYDVANGPQQRAAAAMCARYIRLAMIGSRLGAPDARGISIQSESFDATWAAAETLMTEHCLAVGEDADMWRTLNEPLFRKYDEVGALICVTARCNGRMLGYLATVVNESLERRGLIQATQLGLFVSRDAKGANLGLRLASASVAAAKRRGAGKVFIRAGMRGDGPRIGVVARRLGAKESGVLHEIDLEAA